VDEELSNQGSPPATSVVPTPPPGQRKSNRPILITLLCAFLLGGGSCFGFMTTLNSHGGSSTANSAITIACLVFAIAFVVCALTFVGGLIWALVAFLNNRNRKG
jgi:lysylphosphatidylglycerol synthetase-like protein (DUF2156 family)